MYLYFNSNLTTSETDPFIKLTLITVKQYIINIQTKRNELCHILHQMLFTKNQNLTLRRQILARNLNLIKKNEH